MKPKTILWTVLIFIELTAGVWLLVFSGRPVSEQKPDDTTTFNQTDFQQTFWGDRPLDLVLQACLIISGALGVAALLPAKDEE